MENKIYTNTPFDTKSTNEEDRTIEFIATKNIVDRDGDIVSVPGVDISKMIGAPLLFSHQQSQPPIGVITSMKKVGDSIIGRAKFATKEVYEFADTIYRLVKGGFIRAVSQSFIPDYDAIEYKTIDNKQVRVIGKSEMIEVSIVAIGANQEALITGKSLEDAWNENIIDGDELNTLKKLLDTKPSNRETTNKELDILKKQLLDKDNYIKFLEKELEDLSLCNMQEEDIYSQIIHNLTGDGVKDLNITTGMEEDVYEEIIKQLKEDK